MERAAMDDDVVWWCVLLSPCSYLRERRLKRERQPYDYERDYLAAFPDGPYRDAVARFVWDRLQSYVCIRNFPVNPYDSLRMLYKLDDEEIFDVFLCEIIEKILNIDRGYFDFSEYHISLIDNPLDIYSFIMDVLKSLKGFDRKKCVRIPVINIFTKNSL